MGKKTTIAWCDHTFNPIHGCYKVSPACDHCYAETFDRRIGGAHWGVDAPLREFGDKHWAEPLKWDCDAAAAGVRRRVFCASMADVFDNRWPTRIRIRLWALIRATPNLDWLLLTKRIGNAEDMLPPDWGDGYPNVWLGITVVTQDEADRDIPKLWRLDALVRFLSIEPMLEPIDLGCMPWPAGYPRPQDDISDGFDPLRFIGRRIDWVICGGESGAHAREFNLEWAQALREQCGNAGVAFFMKQVGAKPVFKPDHFPNDALAKMKDRAGADPAEWPYWLRVQQFPRVRPYGLCS